MDEYDELARDIVFRSHISIRISKIEQDLLNSIDSSQILASLKKLHFDNSFNGVVRTRALHAILALKNIDKVSILLESLDTDDDDWRQAYIIHISNFEDERAREKLSELLISHPDPDTRYTAAQSLADIGSADTIPLLLQVYENDQDLDWEGFSIAEAALEAVQKIKQRLSLTM